MAAPRDYFPPPEHHQHHQFLPQPEEQKQGKENSRTGSFRNVYTLDGELTPPDLAHPPYIPPFHVVGFAPGPVDEGCGFQLNCLPEQGRNRLKEQDFMENNSHLSSVDFFQARPVSTGLGLSLDNTNLAASSGDSYFLSMLGDEIDQELQRQDAEIDRYLKIQGEQLRKVIHDKIQSDQLQTIAYIEEKVLQKLREREGEMEIINQKNSELEDKIEQLAMEVGAWQDRAKYTENMINLLKFNLQQVSAQTKVSKEWCGDSEVDDTTSCCNDHSIAFHPLHKDNRDAKELMTCKVCRSREVCMLLFPCKHLCLCKDCESRFPVCPLCQCSKIFALEVHMDHKDLAKHNLRDMCGCKEDRWSQEY